MIRAIIVEDETKSRMLLSNLLSSYCKNVTVVDMAESVAIAIESIRKHAPDLLFLDIVLQRENGFDVLEKLKEIEFEIIFTTAHNEYAIKAIRVCALDYLLKPINIKELQAAVQKAEKKIAAKEAGHTLNERLVNFLKNQESANADSRKIALPTQDGLKFITIGDILYCQADGNYTRIFQTDHKNLVTRTLKEFEELLSEHNFFRIHRSYLVNLSHVLEYNRTNTLGEKDGDGGSVTLANRTQLPVSREKKSGFVQRLSSPF